VRNWIAISIGFALLLGGTAQGQTTKDSYPSRPVRIIVPFAAGGPGDIFARLIGQKLSEQLGQQFFIENRPGASGNIGTAVAARAPADGYTLMVGSSAVWINASLYPQIPYDPVKDFEPIIIGATSPEVLVVHPSVPARSVQELVTLVRAGKYTNFAIAGVGTPPHLSTELFKLSLKLDIVMVPFGGGGPMVQSVVAGHTPVAFSTLPAASGQHLRSRAQSASRYFPTCRPWKKPAYLAKCRRRRNACGYPWAHQATSSTYSSAKSRVRLPRRTSRRKWRQSVTSRLPCRQMSSRRGLRRTCQNGRR
jgi:tripartite-type tricarboxylate transporter receptor subunit TctC